jgi:hypothetical protein
MGHLLSILTSPQVTVDGTLRAILNLQPLIQNSVVGDRIFHRICDHSVKAEGEESCQSINPRIIRRQPPPGLLPAIRAT